MSSISYCGRDFSPYVQAELIDPGAHVVASRSLAVPGRAGAALLGGEVEPRVLAVRLFWDGGLGLGDAGRAGVRHRLRSWLLAPAGGELVVPGDPEVTYRDAVCTGCDGWSSLFEDGSCEVEFTCFDPIAYGRRVETAETPVVVGGTWRTWPTVRLVAVTGGSVSVGDGGTGRSVRVERAFSAGDVVELDFLAETVRVNGADASADVTLDSDFFALEPGTRPLQFSGCSAHVVSFYERWA